MADDDDHNDDDSAITDLRARTSLLLNLSMYSDRTTLQLLHRCSDRALDTPQ
jgi:hypothetical protein